MSLITDMEQGIPIRMGRTTMRVYCTILEGRDKGLPPPTFHEFRDLLGVKSHNSLQMHFKKLEKMGLIRLHRGGGARALTPLYRAEFYKEEP